MFVGGILSNAKLTVYLHDFDGHIMPYISNEEDITKSHLSDHQILEIHVNEYTIYVFNVLSKNSMTEPPLKSGFNRTKLVEIEDEFSSIIAELYSSITFTE